MKWGRERVGKRAGTVGKETFVVKKGKVKGRETWYQMDKKWKWAEIGAKMLQSPEIRTIMSNFSDRNMQTL